MADGGGGVPATPSVGADAPATSPSRGGSAAETSSPSLSTPPRPRDPRRNLRRAGGSLRPLRNHARTRSAASTAQPMRAIPRYEQVIEAWHAVAAPCWAASLRVLVAKMGQDGARPRPQRIATAFGRYGLRGDLGPAVPDPGRNRRTGGGARGRRRAAPARLRRKAQDTGARTDPPPPRGRPRRHQGGRRRRNPAAGLRSCCAKPVCRGFTGRARTCSTARADCCGC